MQGHLLSARGPLGGPKNGNIGWGPYGVKYQGLHTSEYDFVVPWQAIKMLHRQGEKVILIFDELNLRDRIEVKPMDKGAAIFIEQIHHFYQANGRLPDDLEFAAIEAHAKSQRGGCFGLVVLGLVVPAIIYLLFYSVSA